MIVVFNLLIFNYKDTKNNSLPKLLSGFLISNSRIYEVCNDCQFGHLSGSDFVNLKPTVQPVTVRPKENLRVCYMVLSVSQTVKPRERGRQWAEDFLQRCGISKSYYDKHRNDVCAQGATRENREYRKSIDRAIEKNRQQNRTP